MKGYALIELAKIMDAKHFGENVIITNVTIDSRNIKKGDLFIAIKGENFDGHDFIEQAIANGASAILSETKLSVETAYLQVKDCRKALGKFAAFHRQQCKTFIIGLTGSLGKTTTKAMLASILRQSHQVLAPEASMNNDIGLPLTLLQLQPEHEYAVIEIGTNHFGEINYVTQIAKPDLAMITNIASAHLEFFGNVKNVAKEKADIFSGLKANSKVVLNKDDDFYDYFRGKVTPYDITTFGLDKNADVYAENIKLDSAVKAQFDLHINSENIPVQLNVLGEHNVMNAIAAATCAYLVNCSLSDIKKGLEQTSAVSKRLSQKEGLKGVTIIDDSYSAIPNAVTAALDILANVKTKKVFVFGGMAELNPDQVIHAHRQVGEKAKQIGVDYLLAINENAKYTLDGFGETGKFFEDKASLILALKSIVDSDMTVLVKGSRGAKMEEVVAAISSD